MIITFYHADGRKERRPLGYAGAECHAATAPYETRDVPGSVTKTPTREADEEPTRAETTTQLKATR